MKIGTVAELRKRMTAIEWRDWYTYFRRRRQEEELEALKQKARASRRK